MEGEASGLTAQPLMAPINPVAAHELAIEQIKRCIQLGLFLPGEKLPPERMLAERLSVSRSTIREAVRVLQEAGYLSVRRGAAGGLIVHDAHVEDPEELRQWIRTQRSHLNELLDYRMVIEGAAAEFAARRRTDEDLARMDEALARMDRTKQGSARQAEAAAEFNAADTVFHLEIASAARNGLLLKAVEDIRREMYLPFGGFFVRARTDADVYHRNIYDAIFDRDDARAGEMMRLHINSTKKAIITFLDADRLKG